MGVSSLIWVRMSDMEVGEATWGWRGSWVGVVGGDVGGVGGVGGGRWGEQVVGVLGVRRVVGGVHHLANLQCDVWFISMYGLGSKSPSAVPPR